jgi:hypothetical protein
MYEVLQSGSEGLLGGALVTQLLTNPSAQKDGGLFGHGVVAELRVLGAALRVTI